MQLLLRAEPGAGDAPRDLRRGPRLGQRHDAARAGAGDHLPWRRAAYRRARLVPPRLPLLRRRFGQGLRLGIQSNLWLLDDETCELFREHRVSIGTSLDGPEAVNDAQRGAGYFARTMAGIETARRNGLSAGIICTFTRRSAPHYREVFEFFAGQGLGFSVHAAVCGLDAPR